MEAIQWNELKMMCPFLGQLGKKARFARDRAARGWSLAYQGSCIDPMDQSKPLDPTLKVAGARRTRTIRLLINDF